MKGIILAGGRGTRLYPITKTTTKSLLSVYDKPMVYYPLSTLMLADIKDVLIICNPEDKEQFQKLLKDGKHLGINISYAIQTAPRGIADAFVVAEDFIKNDDVCLILGDNIFYGADISEDVLKKGIEVVKNKRNGVIFSYRVNNPERYGVVKIDKRNGKISSIEEKPKKPKSNYAVVGLYMYDSDVVSVAKNIEPSERGELEITSVNNKYLEENRLELVQMGRGYTYFDSGTYDSLLESSTFVYTVQSRQGLMISCIEEIAFNKGWINKEQLIKLSEGLGKNKYSEYLYRIAIGEE